MENHQNNERGSAKLQIQSFFFSNSLIGILPKVIMPLD
jgi:hypothetical protein